MTRSTRVIVIALFALAPGRAWAQAAIVPVPGTTTRDIPFTSHDGHPMLGRLTLPDAPGPHPVLMLVQTAEAATMDGELRNSKGVRVRIYNQYRALLAPMGIGFFSYEGRGVTSNAGGGPVIDRTVYNTACRGRGRASTTASVRLSTSTPGRHRRATPLSSNS